MLHLFNKTLLGIDIGSYSVKVVCLKGGPPYTLKGASCVRIPHGMTPEDMPGFISEILIHQKIYVKRAAALLSGHSLTFRHLNLPDMPKKDLREAVKWEIRKEVAIPPNEIISEFVLADRGENKESALSIISFSAMRGDVVRTMDLFKKIGIELRIIEVIPTALLSDFDVSESSEDDMNFAMIDIGESTSTVAVIKNKKLMFAREISFGGRDLTAALSRSLKITEEEAEEMKITSGLEVTATEGVKTRETLTERLESGLCSELHRSFEYYHAQFREGSVDKAFVSGGTARLKGIDDFMAETIGIPCFVDDPFRKMRITNGLEGEALRSAAPCFSVATGLAARMAGV